MALPLRTSGKCSFFDNPHRCRRTLTPMPLPLVLPSPSNKTRPLHFLPPSALKAQKHFHPTSILTPLPRKHAAHTYLGTTISGYPSLFHLYGPHGPTLLSNGPTSVEMQGRWIVDCIKQIRSQNLKYIDPKKEASLRWKQRINELSDASLFPTTKSTYMGGSMEGKAFEMTCYAGGIPQYVKEIRSVLPELTGFRVVKA